MRPLTRALVLASALSSPAWADTGRVTADSDTDDTDEASETEDEEEYYPTGGRTVQCATVPGQAAGLAALALAVAALRRRSVRGLGGLLALLIVLAGAPAQAQGLTPGLDVQRFDPAGMAGGFATVTSARQLAKKTFSFELTGTYAWRPLQRSIRVADTFIREAPAIDHLGAAHARVAVGATDWLQIALHMPVVQGLSLAPALDTFAGPRAAPVAVGDLTLDLAFRPLGEERGVGLAIVPFVTAPTGSRAYLLTDGTVAFGGRVALSGQAGIVHMAAYGGYKVKVGSSTVGAFYAVDDEVLYGAGVGVDLYRNMVRLNGEFTGTTVVGPGFSAIRPSVVTGVLHTGLEAGGNLSLALPVGFSLVAGGSAGLTPAPGVPAARAYLGVGYVPFVDRDLDGDSVVDRLDRCLRKAEDLDGIEDEDGCPEGDDDQDGDGIPDEEDACRGLAEDFDGFRDEDGCPEHDNDGDGIPDAVDACIDQPEDLDGFQDQDGCPEDELDSDGDGVLDGADPCATLAEDFDGFQDEDGCPEPDNDGDGLLDTVDACPDAAEDMDGVQDDDGCPEGFVDTDGDGIPDEKDLCPQAPEVVNGVDDTDGCPDEGLVRLTGERIEILEHILFFTAEARIRPESFGVLDAVVAVLRDHPDVQRVRIEGHTDSQGSDAYNEDLSERRALAVREYLIGAGISSTRLLARGFGEAYPVAPNSTEEGRTQNRRVEFVILDPTDPAY